MTGDTLFRPARAGIRSLYDRLLEAYGAQAWWPGDTRLEVLVGAVLTQNTAWRNVERAIANLKTAGMLEWQALLTVPEADLATLIRPAGYFNVKARRLQNLLRAIAQGGGEVGMKRAATADLRKRLLAVRGVGPETADAIVLYGFGRPVFVVDTYTRRLFARLGWIRGDEQYEALRQGVERQVAADTAFLQELHALIVAHAKAVCRKVPRCDHCVLRRDCPAAEQRCGTAAPGNGRR
jgi:endonuclease-3 related protein